MLSRAESAALQHAADLPVLQEPDSRSRLLSTCRSRCSCSWARPTPSTSPTASTGWRSARSAWRRPRSPRWPTSPATRVLADYLLLVRFPPAGELTIFCGALVGASLGFLWYNSYPAEIFMGDVGSLGARRRARHGRHPDQAGAAAADRRRRLRARGAVGDHPGRVVQARPASASSRWRRSTITSS